MLLVHSRATDSLNLYRTHPATLRDIFCAERTLRNLSGLEKKCNAGINSDYSAPAVYVGWPVYFSMLFALLYDKNVWLHVRSCCCVE